MDIEKVIERNKANIRRALADYGRHTYAKSVLNDVSDAFIDQLAVDNAYSKRALRELFSTSPVWNEELDALIINGTRTHDPDPNRIRSLALQILDPAKYADTATSTTRQYIDHAIEFFTRPNDPDMTELPYLVALSPKACAPGRKLSRVFRTLCKDLGIVDDGAGSQFQRLYAQFADELTTRKIGFKLFVSINPGHFLTMSNPKQDERGNTLTSCHSFNVTDYEYNNGCIGYARDDVSLIAFTVADPTDSETLNNRKTTRQIFAYRVGGGLLLQSRMYNTSGGVYGAAEDSKLYRDLVQREISALENAVNLWKTYRSYDERGELVPVAEGFGGYADWTYRDFDGHVSIRFDHLEDAEPMEIGAPGLCIVCGAENSDGLYCDDCREDDRECCAECGGHFDEDDLYPVRDRHGDVIYVCEDCRDRYYAYCDRCEEYYPDDEVTSTGDECVCRACLDEYYDECDECGEYFDKDDMFWVINARGHEVRVCQHCLEEYYRCCNGCGQWVHDDLAEELFDEDGDPTDEFYCESCAENRFEHCDDCGHLHRPIDLIAGYCAKCRSAHEEEIEIETETEKEEQSA